MQDIRNGIGKLVCRIDKNSKTVEIAVKGCITTISFLADDKIKVTNTNRAV